jgi:hypothetical protein
MGEELAAFTSLVSVRATPVVVLIPRPDDDLFDVRKADEHVADPEEK